MGGEFTMGGSGAVGGCVKKGCCGSLFIDDANDLSVSKCDDLINLTKGLVLARASDPLIRSILLAINGVENRIANTEINSSNAAPEITLVNEGPGGALVFTPNAGNNQASGWLFLRGLFTGDTF
jgi:hypothetical protein